jgi:hypothetical protein
MKVYESPYMIALLLLHYMENKEGGHLEHDLSLYIDLHATTFAKACIYIYYTALVIKVGCRKREKVIAK